MGFSCEKAHHRTSSSKQSWIESIGCEQLQLQEPAAAVAASVTSRRHSQRQHHQHYAYQQEHKRHSPSAEAPPSPSAVASAATGSSFHYPFNLFHPFHSSSLQYSTIILDKLSQFITKHVAARSGSVRNSTHTTTITSPSPGRPTVHSHNTGSRSFPEAATLPRGAPACDRPREAASSPASSCDPAVGTGNGCTAQQTSSLVSPSTELSESSSSSLAPPSSSPLSQSGVARGSASHQPPSTTASHPHNPSSPAPRQTTLNSTCTTTTETPTATPTTTTTTTTARPTTSSHYLVRHSLCLYAASSVILALCYLTIPTVASDTPHTIFAEGKSDKEILDHLLKGSRYDKRLLPPVDGSLTVNVSVLLLSLASPDESSLKYEVEFLLQQQWYDPRLRYANQSSYEFLNAIHHHEDIWLPDTYFIMHGDFKDPIVPMHFALRIFRNGTINYLMRRHLILSCQGRLNIFPFDDPLCSFAIESISYEQSAIRYVWKNDEDTLRKSPSLTTLNAYLIQNQTITCPIKASWRGNYSCLKVDLMFTRDRAFYFTTVFIPGIILVTSSFITFWLEWNAVPARVMIGVTTMLNFFTTSNGFRSTLPVVSNLTAMNVWDGVCMCFIYASLLEFVCVNYVGRKRPLHNVVYRPGENPVTQRLPAVLNRIGIILASPLTSRIFSSNNYLNEQETIENEFHTAIAAEKGTAASPPGQSSATVTASSAATTATAATREAAANGRTSPTSATASTASPAPSRPASILLEEGLGGDGSRQRGVANRPPSSVETKINEMGVMETSFGVKKRESSGPNEIVACTSCAGGTSPCTHSANNGCATETCFVQVRKKEPPHPIRVAKTIDVIARITFPSAYAVFLIFFFIHYKGFS